MTIRCGFLFSVLCLLSCGGALAMEEEVVACCENRSSCEEGALTFHGVIKSVFSLIEKKNDLVSDSLRNIYLSQLEKSCQRLLDGRKCSNKKVVEGIKRSIEKKIEEEKSGENRRHLLESLEEDLRNSENHVWHERLCLDAFSFKGLLERKEELLLLSSSRLNRYKDGSFNPKWNSKIYPPSFTNV